MMSNTEQFDEVVRRLEKAEQGLASLARTINGELPQGDTLRTLRERLETVEWTVAASNVADADANADANPFVQGQSPREPDHGMPLLDIEWGVPKVDPSSDPTATIVLRPCQADGTEYGDADDVCVYIRNDRAEVQIEPRLWKATAGAVIGTILSFLRFPWDVGTAPAVHGVLIGEDDQDKVRVSVDDDVAGFLRFTAGDQQAHHKIIGDAELDARECSGNTRYWIQAVVIQEGAEEQLKIEHIGPGSVQYRTGYGTCEITWDDKGHGTGWFDCTGTWCSPWGKPDPDA